MRQAKKFMKRTAMLLVMVTVLLSSGMATGMFTGDLITAEAAAMKLNVKTAELVPNESLSLSISNAGKKKVVWKSSNKKVATVSAKGKVTAKDNVGKSCTITATVGKKNLKCKISVVESRVYATYLVYVTNVYLHGIAADGKTYVENAKAEYIDVLEKKDGYYVTITEAHNYDVTDYLVEGEGEDYLGKKLPDCFKNPTKYDGFNAINMFMDANNNLVYEAWKEYNEDSWDQRMKELGFEI